MHITRKGDISKVDVIVVNYIVFCPKRRKGGGGVLGERNISVRINAMAILKLIL